MMWISEKLPWTALTDRMESLGKEIVRISRPADQTPDAPDTGTPARPDRARSEAYIAPNSQDGNRQGVCH